MRKNIFLLFVFIFIHTYSQTSVSVSVDSIITFSKKQMGIRYHYAHCTPKEGFDCSGFVYFVFNQFKIKVPRASMDYEKMGRIISPDSCKPGDIIVFTGTNEKNLHPGHVGIVLSNPGEVISFIHSSSGKKHSGVTISNFKDSPGYKIRFIKIVRLQNLN
jgi:cell wall-associated NlpC family hydrolase